MQVDTRSEPAPVAGFDRRAWIVIGCAAAVVSIAMGIRQSFGVFLRPVGDDLALGRDALAFAIAIQHLLFGLAQPGVGWLADRFGALPVLAIGTVLYMAGLILAAVSTTTMGFTLTWGLLIGIGLSGTTYVVVLGVVGQVVPPERRGLAFGLVTAAGSFGMFAVVPVARGFIALSSWEGAHLWLTALASIMFLAALGLRRPQQRATPVRRISAPTPAADDPPFGPVARAASRHSGYWLLNAGFFVCGFHIAFIATHLPAYLEDSGIDPLVGTMALALIGLANIAGSFAFGWLSDRYRKKIVLSWLYLWRAIAIAVFVLVPLSPASALLFSAVIGFLWLGTIPPTSGLVAQMFGTRYLSTLYGMVFLTHQIGSFLGAYLGGVSFNLLGSYDAVWWVSVLLGVLAAILHLPIRDGRVEIATAPALKPVS